MSDDIEIELLQNNVEIEIVQLSLDIELIEQQNIQIDLAESPEINVELIEPAPIEIHFAPGAGGGGAVDSVNGQTGVVVLDFVETIVPGAGVQVDDTDPANPIISATALPQEIYSLQNQETTSSFSYVGYEADQGDWYIYRRTRSNNLREYAFGATDYPTNWNNRASLTYS